MKRKRTQLSWLILGVALLSASVPAKNIYKFQDENGIWHFTDQAPDEEIEFSTVYMEREPEPRIHLRQEGTKESPIYILFNDFWGPVEVAHNKEVHFERKHSRVLGRLPGSFAMLFALTLAGVG